MADNRLWLVNKQTGERCLLGKYDPTPSQGWWVWKPSNLAERVDAVLAGPVNGPVGGREFELEYDE